MLQLEAVAPLLKTEAIQQLYATAYRLPVSMFSDRADEAFAGGRKAGTTEYVSDKTR